MMMTHYKKPIDFSQKKLKEAEKALISLVNAAVPCEEPCFCPVEILECYCDDMNTAKAIAILHRYRKTGKGEDLFKSLKFLGFFGGSVHIHETKTLPNVAESNFGPDVLIKD